MMGLRRIDWQTVIRATMIGGTVCAFLALLLGGALLGNLSGPIADLVVWLLPIAGAVVAVVSLWVLVFGYWQTKSSSFAPEITETVESTSLRQIGSQTDQRLTDAAGHRYDGEVGLSSDRIREELTEGAVRAVKTSTGRNEMQARETITEGTWTDDRIAVAFLSDEFGQPFRERLRGAIDPARAYHRRVRHTIDAIETIENQYTIEIPADEDASQQSGTTDQQAEVAQ